MITRQHTQESLSRAYASIIAGVAGVNLVIGREYDYGVDGEFRTVVREGPDLIEDGHTLDFQLKSTVNWRESSDHIAYPCKLAAYNKLAFRANSSPTRCILILLCLPRGV